MQVGDLFFSKSRRSALELERFVLLSGDRHDGLFIDDVKPLANGVIAWQEVQLRTVVKRGPREPLVAAPSSLPSHADLGGSETAGAGTVRYIETAANQGHSDQNS